MEGLGCCSAVSSFLQFSNRVSLGQRPPGVGELDCFLLEADETIGFVLLDNLEHAEGISVGKGKDLTS